MASCMQGGRRRKERRGADVGGEPRKHLLVTIKRALCSNATPIGHMFGPRPHPRNICRFFFPLLTSQILSQRFSRCLCFSVNVTNPAGKCVTKIFHIQIRGKATGTHSFLRPFNASLNFFSPSSGSSCDQKTNHGQILGLYHAACTIAVRQSPHSRIKRKAATFLSEPFRREDSSNRLDASCKTRARVTLQHIGRAEFATW